MNSDKVVLYICISIGGLLGAYLPTWLWRADPLGLWGILGGMVGGLAGVWVWYKIGRM